MSHEGRDSKCVKKIVFWAGPGRPLDVLVGEKTFLQPFCTGIITHRPLPGSSRGCHPSSRTARPSGMSRESPTDSCAALPSETPGPCGLTLGSLVWANMPTSCPGREAPQASPPGWTAAPTPLSAHSHHHSPPAGSLLPGVASRAPPGRVVLLACDTRAAAVNCRPSPLSCPASGSCVGPSCTGGAPPSVLGRKVCRGK